MKNKPLFFSILAVAFLAIYLLFFRGCKEESMRITTTLRPPRRGAQVERGTTPMYEVYFGFNQKYGFTAVKVVAAQDISTNKYPRALWHLVADTNPARVKAIKYGQPVPGMKPAVAELEPDPLEPNIEYVLLVEAGKLHARTNFIARARPVR